MSGTEQPRVGDQERDDEVQAAAHPGRHCRVTRSDQRTLVDQRQHESDDERDPDGPVKIAPLRAERNALPYGRAATTSRPP